MKRYKITIVGMGYVGMSLAVILSRNHFVYAIDVNKDKLKMIADGESPIADEDIDKYLADVKQNICTTCEPHEAYSDSDFIIISVPTNYDTENNTFDTSIVEAVLKDITATQSKAGIIIKSTIPIGFTERMRLEYKNDHIFFSPEFLRETKAVYDNLHPSRIIVGTDKNVDDQIRIAEEFSGLLVEASLESEVPVLIIGLCEAEAIKLFSNTYLAMRVAFFNELDTYAETKGFDSKEIIEGVCMDPRIGDYYNNPSFGYGGYCLPKDTKQLLANYNGVSEALVKAIVDSNRIRKEYIADKVMSIVSEVKDPENDKNVIGVFRLVMKSGSGNYRNSAVQEIIKILTEQGMEVIIYEPSMQDGSLYCGGLVVNDLSEFKERSRIIIANRYDKCLDDVQDIVYSRDLFSRD